jgi:hypothetical protein
MVKGSRARLSPPCSPAASITTEENSTMNTATMIRTIIEWGPNADFDAKIAECFPTATDSEITYAMRVAVAELRKKARQLLTEADALQSKRPPRLVVSNGPTDPPAAA